MKKLYRHIVAFSFVATAAIADSEPKEYVTRLISQHYDGYLAMLDGRDPLEIEDISTLADNRSRLEPLILQVAPVLGGCNCRVVYKPYEEYTPHARTIEQVRKGIDLTHGIAGFTDDSRYQDGIYLSDPILRPENFFVGFYTHADRDEVMSITDDDAIRDLRFAVGRTWEIDRKVIAENGFKEVTGDAWQNLIMLIVAKRADVIMQPFIAGSDDLSFVDGENQDIVMRPIPNVKMQFGQGRHYMVSAAHPDGKEFLAALNRGIAILHENGTLRKAMINAGVISQKAESFREFK